MRNVNSVLIGRVFTIVEINACLKERETTTQPLALASSSTRGWRSHPVYREGAGGQGLLPYSRVRRYITSRELTHAAGTADGPRSRACSQRSETDFQNPVASPAYLHGCVHLSVMVECQ